jgi:hypothetical protein
VGEAERLRDPRAVIASPCSDGTLAARATQHRTARQREDSCERMACATWLPKVREQSEHCNERTWMCYHQAPPLARVVAHVGMPGKHSPTSNTTLYRFWEPVMQPLYEN